MSGIYGGTGRNSGMEKQNRLRRAFSPKRLVIETLEERMLLQGVPLTQQHYHPHLTIIVDGVTQNIPTNIGVSNAGVIDNPHTHDGSGLLHMHPLAAGPAATPATVGDFFRVWRTNAGLAGNNPNAIFNSNQILNRVADANHAVRMFVNGVLNNQFENYVPFDGDQIIISYDTVGSADSPTLAPIGSQTLISSKSLHVPLDGFDPNGGAVTFAVSSNNPNVSGQVVTGNPYLRLNVSGRDRNNNPFSGDLVFELYQDLAPATVARISTLVNSGFYTNVRFHRIINDFMAQGGDPLGTGTGGTGVRFSDEFTTQLAFTGFGQLAMANSGDDTNDSQFFITDLDLRGTTFAEASKAPPQHLNFNHTIFGQLVEGFNVFQEMMLTELTGSTPDSPVTINSAAIIQNTQNAVLRLTALPGFTGNTNITVTATDPQSLTTQRNFQLNVIADTVNDRPFLGTVTNVATNENAAVTIPLPATDLENDTLTFVIRDPNNFNVQPANVTVSINQTTRQATITPNANFAGTVNLLVGVRDNTRRVDTNLDGQITNADNIDDRGNFDTQLITLTVNSVNTRPTATPQTVLFQGSTPVGIQLAGDDGDPDVVQTLTFQVQTLPANGTLRDSNNQLITVNTNLPNGSVTYTPNAGFTGQDQFTFRVQDSGGTANGGADTSNPATVTLTQRINNAPTATPQNVNFQAGAPINIQLAGTDGDPDVNQTLSFIVSRLPTNGTLRDSSNNLVTAGTVLPSANVTYTPNAGFTGTDTFNFRTRDNGGTTGGGQDTSAEATVTLRGPRNGRPAPTPRLRNGVLSLIGTSDIDIIDVDTNAAGDTIIVMVNGAPAVNFPAASVTRIRIHCGAGDDEVTISEDVEISAWIRGGRGNDILTGGGGDDVIRGRRGDDEVHGGSGDDQLFGGGGRDELMGGDGDDQIRGRRGSDTCMGGNGNDLIRGGRRNDMIDGGPGTDTARGGRGDDNILNAEVLMDRANSNGAGNRALQAANEHTHGAHESAIAALVAERSLSHQANANQFGFDMHDDNILHQSPHANAVDLLLGS